MSQEYENYDDMAEKARRAVEALEENPPHAVEDDALAAGALILPGFDFDAEETYWNVILGEINTQTNAYRQFTEPFVAANLDEALDVCRVTLTWLTEGRTPSPREYFEQQLRDFVLQAEEQGLDRKGAIQALLALVERDDPEAEDA